MKNIIDKTLSAVICWHAGGRHHVRILRDKTTITFRAGEGEGAVYGHILNETTYQSRRDGLTNLRLQKFITEPTRIDPGSLLKEWRYTSRIENAGAVQPIAELSESRSLTLDFTLPHPMEAGETFTLSEEMEIRCDLRNQEAVFSFQVRDPTDRRAVHMIFEGLCPENALFCLDNGHRDYTEGVLEMAVTGGRFRGFHYTWKKPRPGEELRLAWSWPERAVEAARESFKRLHPANVPELANSFASRVIAGDMGPATEGGEDEGARAEDHPLIKAARARLKTSESGE